MNTLIKGIKFTWIKLGFGKTASFDMSNVVIKDSHGNEITLRNEEFEQMIKHYNERKQQIEELNS
jgi:hypothetical protein